ncbi:TPA: hypothetical protein PCC25_004695 [Klebsiella quasipneumoniae]|uniref:hypothetical protein n=1 Tax=Klebsiella pneumoniae complex TaxID=3390273 RepID=UPI0021CB6D2B|nr:MULTISPECIES: hypothetical protein [Klebsiella]HCD2097548.1 hypothetical protein [Klebsiella pneumoniae]MCU4141204.1 hypothetical protein [Klebsiella quasipneumoniae]MCU4151649.1 hypothetical protein [Klebsiella quasipneumoniae]HBQ5098546.1 hypothetical protein [Klebsiella variicola]HDE1484142.1 hypothetical protein [Klebsiella quasipneumoniae]
MTTDITELAQSEINDALAQLKQISEYPTPSTQYARVLRKYIATMVETLEKAQGMEAYWKAQCRGITDHCEELQARIAELESRTVTVKLSKDHVDDADLFGWGVVVVPLEALKDACVNAGVTVEIADDGIKVEAE